MYMMYDILEILRQLVQLAILVGCGAGVVLLILVLRSFQKFMNQAADLGIHALTKLCNEMDDLERLTDELELEVIEEKSEIEGRDETDDGKHYDEQS